MKPLTPRKKQIVDFINSYNQTKSFSPSISEIAKKFKLAISTIHQHLEELEDSGYLKREKNQRRGVEVSNIEQMISIPLLGTIAAGEPIHIFEEEKERIIIPKNKLQKSSGVYALRVKGDSMINENIHDGDTILIKNQNTAENGDKVVTLLNGDEATLKTFYKEKGYVKLQPANAARHEGRTVR